MPLIPTILSILGFQAAIKQYLIPSNFEAIAFAALLLPKTEVLRKADRCISLSCQNES